MFPYSLQAHFPTCYGTRLTPPFSLVPSPWWLYPPLPLLPPLPPHAHPSHTHPPNTRSYPEAHTCTQKHTEKHTQILKDTHTTYSRSAVEMQKEKTPASECVPRGKYSVFVAGGRVASTTSRAQGKAWVWAKGQHTGLRWQGLLR